MVIMAMDGGDWLTAVSSEIDHRPTSQAGFQSHAPTVALLSRFFNNRRGATQAQRDRGALRSRRWRTTEFRGRGDGEGPGVVRRDAEPSPRDAGAPHRRSDGRDGSGEHRRPTCRLRRPAGDIPCTVGTRSAPYAAPCPVSGFLPLMKNPVTGPLNLFTLELPGPLFHSGRHENSCQPERHAPLLAPLASSVPRRHRHLGGRLYPGAPPRARRAEVRRRPARRSTSPWSAAAARDGPTSAALFQRAGRADHRRGRPARSRVSLDALLLPGLGGPQTGPGRDREALRGEDAQLPLRRVRGLPRACSTRRKSIDAVLCATPDHLHAYGLRSAHAAGQARLLREAAHAQRLGGPPGGAGGQGNRRGHADGQPGPFQRRHPRRRASGSGTARSGRSARSTPGASASRWNKHRGRRRRTRRPCRPASTGTCGSARASPAALPPGLRCRSRGATSGRSAPAAWATSAATTWTRPSGRWTCARRSASKPRTGRGQRCRDRPAG